MKAKQEETLDLAKSILNNGKQLSILEMSLSVKNIFDSSNIKSVFKGENAPIAYAVMNLLVKRFLESFGFSTKLNEPQIETITVDALEHFSYESIEDAIIFFKMARQGKFGTTNRGVDSNLIFGTWMPMYLNQKSDLREQKYEKEKNDQFSKNLSAIDVLNHYEKLKGNTMRNRVINFVDNITLNFDRQMLEDLIYDWEKDPIRKPYLDILTRKRLTIRQNNK